MPRALDLLKLMRPKQWAKGVFVLVGPVYAMADHKAAWQHLLIPGVVGFVAFALVSSACYILNDIVDAPRDRLHPRKSRRPIASGRVSAPQAGLLMGVLFVLGAALPFALPAGPRVWLLLLGSIYACNTIGYSLRLKHVVIVDVMSLSLGFVLRVLGGCAAADVTPSTWLLNCTLFLAMFLAFGKRLGERRTMGDDAGATRHVQLAYTDELLRMAVVVTGVATLVTYAGYIQSRELMYQFPVPGLLATFNPLWLTMIPASYALLRCIVLLEKGDYDDPTELAARDFPMQASVLAFGAVTMGVLWWHLVAGTRA